MLYKNIFIKIEQNIDKNYCLKSIKTSNKILLSVKFNNIFYYLIYNIKNTFL